MTLSAGSEAAVETSGLRRILKDIAEVADAPDWLNLGAGNPASIPGVVEAWRALTLQAVEDAFVSSATRYGPTSGSAELVSVIVDYFNARYGWDIDAEHVLVGPGSQLLCYAASVVFTATSGSSPLKVVLPMLPDYPGYFGLGLSDGAVVGTPALVETLGANMFRYRYDFDAIRCTPHMGALLISSPANPTGRTATVRELSELVGIAEERNVPLVVDHAYGEPFPVVVRGAHPPVLHRNVINCFSLSKAGLPGERIGFAIGPPHLLRPMSAMASNAVLHAPMLVQATVSRAMRSGKLDELVSEMITPHYARKRSLAESLLHAELGDAVDWRLHPSEGGMFCWLWLRDEWFNGDLCYQMLKRRKVCIVPGASFFGASVGGPEVAAHASRCIRISLSAKESVIVQGIARIAEVIKAWER